MSGSILAAARAAALLTLLAVAGATLAPLLAAQPLSDWTAMPAVLRLGLAGIALALLLPAELARRSAAAVAILGAIVLGSWLVTAAAGAPQPASAAARALAWRPTVLVALALWAAGASLWLRRRDAETFDTSALLGVIALATGFLVAIGHLFEARALTTALISAPASGLGATLLLLITLTALALHPAGPLSAYAGDNPGAIAKRRLLPAAVLTPIASGFLVLYAITGQQLSPTLAVALVVFANVLVMLLLIDGAGNTVARMARDRQARMEAREAQVRKQGQRDALTALLNRRGWDTEVQAAEKQCRAESLEACVIVIDLDGLKHVNDTQGHKAGDAYLQRAAHALRKAARRGDALARVGGDEFAYLVIDSDEEMARQVVTRFEDTLRAGKVSASVGYAMRKDRALEAAFDEADRAMYAQKRARKLRRA